MKKTTLKWLSSPFLLIPVISLAILVPQILCGGGSGLFGNDVVFHMGRFTDAAMQIKTGHFSYFQQFFTLNNSGKIVNALYGPIVSYFFGLIMLIVGFNGLVFWNIYLFVINVLGLSSMYYFARQQKATKTISLIVGVLFISTGSVAVAINSGTYAVGYAIFPIIVCAAIRLVKKDEPKVKMWELVLAMTLLAQTHMLSLLFGMITFAVAFIVFVFGNLRSQTLWRNIGKVCLAGLAVIILNFNIIGGYLEIMHSNILVAPYSNKVIYPITPDWTVTLFASASASVIILLIMICLICLIRIRHISREEKFALLMTIAFMVLSFGFIDLNNVPGATTLQFYSRFFVIAFVFGLYLLVELDERSIKRWLVVAPAALVLALTLGIYFSTTTNLAKAFENGSFPMTQANGFAYKTKKQLSEVLKDPLLLTDNKFVTDQIGAPWGAADYIPNDTGLIQSEKNTQADYGAFMAYFTNDVIHLGHFEGKNLQRQVTGNGLLISWYSPKEEKTMLPVLKYDHSQLKLNGSLLKVGDYQLSNVGAPIVQAKKGENEMLISYQPRWWFKAGAVIQVLAWFALILGSLTVKVLRVNKKELSDGTDANEE